MNSEARLNELSDNFEESPIEILDSLAEILYGRNPIEIEEFIAYLLFVDLLKRSFGNPPRKSPQHKPELLMVSYDQDTEIIELVIGLQEMYQNASNLRNEESTRKLVAMTRSIGDWFEEIIVFISELAEIPDDLVDWFLEREQAPFESDGDLYNGSRTGRSGVAANSSVSPQKLRILFNDEEWEIRWRLAMNPSSPADLLEQLSRVEEEMAEVIIACVAMNESTSSTTLHHIIESESADLRTLASRNKTATPNLVSLAQELGTVETPFKRWGSGLNWLLFRND